MNIVLPFMISHKQQQHSQKHAGMLYVYVYIFFLSNTEVVQVRHSVCVRFTLGVHPVYTENTD